MDCIFTETSILYFDYCGSNQYVVSHCCDQAKEKSPVEIEEGIKYNKVKTASKM